MNTFLQLMEVFSLTFLSAIFIPSIFWVVIIITVIQYRRLAGMEQKLFGRPINNVKGQVFSSLGLGILGGLLASLVLLILGLSIEQIGLYFLWPVAIILLFIHPRFLCFSYAGGIVGLAFLLVSLLSGYFPHWKEFLLVDYLLRIHLPALLVLIGLLHLIEAFLIFLGGHKGYSPLYIKEPGGQVIGGFSLQRFWPMPLVALLVRIVPQAESDGIGMPQWWPVLESVIQPGVGEALLYMAIPVAAGLGYADLALSSTPREKSRTTARYLGIYSISLLALALAAEYISLFLLPGVIFAFLGHELVIQYGNRREFQGSYYYRQDRRGVKVMMVLPGTIAEAAGFQDEDIILKVNGNPVSNQRDFLERLEEYLLPGFAPGSLSEQIEDFNGEMKAKDAINMPENEAYGTERRPGVILEGLRRRKAFSVTIGTDQSKEWGRKREEVILRQQGAYVPASYASNYRIAALGLILAPSTNSAVYVETRQPKPFAFLRRIFKRKKK